MLPAWWTRKGTKLRLTVRANVKSPKMQGGGGLSLEEIVQVDWDVALGDAKLSLAELRELARLKAPLVKFRGQWVQMNAEEIQEALDFWKKKAQDEAPVRQVLQMALGAAPAPGPIAFEGVTAAGWIGDFLKELEGKTPFQELAVPAEFQGTLRPYQVRGYSWIGFLRKWGLGACLADDMGLGKTIQALALIRRDWQKEAKGPILLICPMSVVGNWQKEASRFTPDLPVMVHHGLDRAKGDEFQKKAASQAMVISSYALLHRDFETIRQVSWSGVVLDEAQNIKNPETKQARAARAISAEYRLALTGTPVENNVGDLWSIMEFLNPGFLGTQTEFKKKFFIPIQTGSDPEAASRLKRLTQPFILRRLKTDRAIITDLPEKMEMKVFCTLTKEQASLYEAVVKEALRGLDKSEGIQRKGVILATLSKLKQVCNHPAQFLGDNSPIPDRSGKLARLTEMAEEILAVGDRALVFSQFAEMGEILKRHLQETFGKEVLFLHGGIPKAKRDRMIERFQTEEDGPSDFRSFPQGRRNRVEPDPRQPCLSLRPLVEPGRGKPGHGPRLPHRPDQERPGPQVHLRRDPGRKDRRNDRTEKGDCREGHRNGRRLAHGALHGRAQRSLRPEKRSDRRIEPWDRWGYFGYFKPSRPRAVKGGIRAQSKGGKFGESWWAKRWISVLESFNIGARLGRGRSYARSGQVLSIETDKGRVRAKVQGSRPKPYEVAIQVKALSSADWQKVVRELSKQALFTAKLLAGEMPQDIEKVFKDARLSVFPEKLKDLKTECSCPDWSNPCKHIAAVYYLLGEEFDRDPFLIFKLRGMSRDEFLALLGQGGKKSLPKGRKPKAAPLPEEEEIAPPGEPLAADISAFWERP